MGMVNQRSPDGSLSYNIIGYERDPSTGRQIPRYEAVTALSEDAQKLRDSSNAANLNLSNLAVSQSGRLESLLSKPMDMNSVPSRADWSGAKPAEYGADLNAPQYSTQGTALPQYGQGTAAPRLSGIGSSAGLQNSYDVGDSSRYEAALMERMNPQLDRQRQQLDTSLANRGIKVGSEAYTRAIEENSRAANDARMAAILNAGQEQSRVTNLNRDQASFGNSARQQEYANATGATDYGNQNAMKQFELAEDRNRYDDQIKAQNYGLSEEQRRYGDTMAGQRFSDQQAIQGRSDQNANNRFSQIATLLDAQDRSRSGAMQEQYAARNQPINEISALLSGAQVNTPNFQMATPDRMQTTDVAGIAQQGYSNQMQAYQQKMQQQNAMYGGLFGLGSAALMGPFGQKAPTTY